MPAELATPTREAGWPGKSSKSEPADPNAAGDPFGVKTIPSPAAPAGAVIASMTEAPSADNSATNVFPTSGMEPGSGSAPGSEPPVSQISPWGSSSNSVTPLGNPKASPPKYVENR